MSSFYSTTKVINLQFLDSNWIATAPISVQYPVKEVIVRTVGYVDSLATAYSGQYSLSLLYSDLIQNNCLAMVNMGLNMAGAGNAHQITSSNPSVRYVFKSPMMMTGTYTFTLYQMDGKTPYGQAVSGPYPPSITLLVEFIEDDKAVNQVSY